jgi:hypothetical protein
MYQEDEKNHVSLHCKKGLKVLRIVGMALVGVMAAVLFGFLFALFIKLLWNWLMPAIFGLTEITYWQAFGIFILAKLLFGSFGHHHGNRHDHFHKKIDAKWHRFIGIEDDEEWQPKGSHKNWKYYRQYWKDEGKAAFEDYIDRMNKKKGEEQE